MTSAGHLRFGRIALAALYVVFAAAGCTSEKGAGTSRSLSQPMTFTEQPLPPLPVPNYKTSGTFPQVSAQGQDLSKANSAIRHAIEADEKQYAAQAKEEEQQNDTSTFNPSIGAGTYEMTPNTDLISATASAVSVLLPITRLYPGGNDGRSWLAITVHADTGQPITLTDVLAHGMASLPAVAAIFKAQLLATDSCIAAAQSDATLGSDFATGFAPTLSDYQYFAFTAHGLAIGFPVGQVSFPTCGRVDAVIPYSIITPYLNSLGTQLARQLR